VRPWVSRLCPNTCMEGNWQPTYLPLLPGQIAVDFGAVMVWTLVQVDKVTRYNTTDTFDS
jgi:hypothetical protein